MLKWYRRWKEIRAAKIVDCSHMKKVPERSRIHLVFTLLYAVAMVSVLWQHCHPVISILILALILPLSLPAFIPYSKLGFTPRFVLQLFLVMFALLWSFYRLKSGTLMDKVCLELLGIAGTTFLMGRRSRDYGYLFLMSTFLLIYGALLPRLLFLYLFAGAVICILAIFYYNRPINLAGDPEIRHPALRPSGTWFYFAIHAFLTLIFFAGIFMLLPKLPTRTEGAFEVSFFTDKDSMLPVPMQKWLHNEKKELKMSPQAPLLIKAGKPNTLSTSGTPTKVKKTPSAATQRAEGNGDGAAQGEDLLFTVKSPLKLYHIARIYNEYDGSVWRVSPILKQAGGRRLLSSEREPESIDIELRYTIRKWISPRLFAPYLPMSFNTSISSARIQLTDLFCGEIAGRTYPALPFNYKVSTRIFLPPPAETPSRENRKCSFWLEGVSRFRYMALPLPKISERLRKLVDRLTGEKKSSMEKALALRDYLRENIPYKLYSDPIPEGRECADYFVFELKTGHCEYYATALAVMARLAGLPSRVATGFSPGNYNTLMNQFEVYEYHAHAWTQIFIEDRGWLTFDATPPQQLVSRTTPAGIGTLRDPFGDEWKMTPPELTERTQTYARELYREKMKEKSVELTKVDEIIAKTLFKEEEKQKAADIRKPVPEKGLAGRLNQFLRESNRKLRDLLDDAKDFTAENGGLLLVLLLPLLSILLLLRILVVALRQHLLQKRAMSFFAKARDLSLTPGERVRALYWGTRLLLNRANLPRKHNQELLEYADSLTKTDPVLARNTAAVFEAFYQLEYGGYAFDEFDVRNLFGKVRPVRKSLLRIIRGGR